MIRYHNTIMPALLALALAACGEEDLSNDDDSHEGQQDGDKKGSGRVAADGKHPGDPGYIDPGPGSEDAGAMDETPDEEPMGTGDAGPGTPGEGSDSGTSPGPTTDARLAALLGTYDFQFKFVGCYAHALYTIEEDGVHAMLTSGTISDLRLDQPLNVTFNANAVLKVWITSKVFVTLTLAADGSLSGSNTVIVSSPVFQVGTCTSPYSTLDIKGTRQ